MTIPGGPPLRASVDLQERLLLQGESERDCGPGSSHANPDIWPRREHYFCERGALPQMWQRQRVSRECAAGRRQDVRRQEGYRISSRFGAARGPGDRGRHALLQPQPGQGGVLQDNGLHSIVLRDHFLH